MSRYLELNGEFQAAKKLHEIMAIAMHDLRAVERLKSVTVDMRVFWTGPGHLAPIFPLSPGHKCTVCFAGAVIHKRAQGLDHKMSGGCGPESFAPNIRRKLWAIDALRTGKVYSAHWRLTGRWPRDRMKTPDRLVGDYKRNREAWWKNMRQLYEELKANNE
jgi:hypothetical protein